VLTWMTSGLIKARKKKNRFYKDFVKKGHSIMMPSTKHTKIN